MNLIAIYNSCWRVRAALSTLFMVYCIIWSINVCALQTFCYFFFQFFFLLRFHSLLSYKQICSLFLLHADTAEVVITQLKEKSKAVSLTQLATFVETLPQIEQDLNRMKVITGNLRVNASQLSDGIKMIFFNKLCFCFSNEFYFHSHSWKTIWLFDFLNSEWKTIEKKN